MLVNMNFLQVSIFYQKQTHSVHPPFLLGGGLNLLPNFQNEGGGLTGPSFLEGVGGKEGVTFLRGGGVCNFYITNKLKSEIFNDKKVYMQKCFSLS